MFQSVQPVHRQPILLDTDGGRRLTELAVDRVEAEDGHYNVLFIGTGAATGFTYQPRELRGHTLTDFYAA